VKCREVESCGAGGPAAPWCCLSFLLSFLRPFLPKRPSAITTCRCFPPLPATDSPPPARTSTLEIIRLLYSFFLFAIAALLHFFGPSRCPFPFYSNGRCPYSKAWGFFGCQRPTVPVKSPVPPPPFSPPKFVLTSLLCPSWLPAWDYMAGTFRTSLISNLLPLLDSLLPSVFFARFQHAFYRPRSGRKATPFFEKKPWHFFLFNFPLVFFFKSLLMLLHRQV